MCHTENIVYTCLLKKMTVDQFTVYEYIMSVKEDDSWSVHTVYEYIMSACSVEGRDCIGYCMVTIGYSMALYKGHIDTDITIYGCNPVGYLYIWGFINLYSLYAQIKSKNWAAE